jgi:hypothetical protein
LGGGGGLAGSRREGCESPTKIRNLSKTQARVQGGIGEGNNECKEGGTSLKEFFDGSILVC